MKTIKSRIASLWLCLACQHRISCCLMKYNSTVISSLWLALLTVWARSLPWEPFLLGKGWLQGFVWEMETPFDGVLVVVILEIFTSGRLLSRPCRCILKSLFDWDKQRQCRLQQIHSIFLTQNCQYQRQLIRTTHLSLLRSFLAARSNQPHAPAWSMLFSVIKTEINAIHAPRCRGKTGRVSSKERRKIYLKIETFSDNIIRISSCTMQ